MPASTLFGLALMQKLNVYGRVLRSAVSSCLTSAGACDAVDVRETGEVGKAELVRIGAAACAAKPHPVPVGFVRLDAELCEVDSPGRPDQ